MKEICYAEHLELRIKLRDLPYSLPKIIYQTVRERYFDAETQKLIALKHVKYKGKVREFMVAYIEDEERALIITIHPLKEHQKLSRIKSDRWRVL